MLRAGGLVAFPTETVYGLGARGLHGAEVAKIFVAKGRPTGHPIILHVDGEAMARTIASEWSESASSLARAFWPGPLTLVVPRRAAVVPDEVTGGMATVGVRAPKHAVALALIAAVGEPLAAPSANAHTHVSPTTAAHVVRSLGGRVDLVLDGGPTAHGIESTVAAVGAGDNTCVRILRPGAVSLEQLQTVAPGATYEIVTVSEQEEPRAAPGMASVHYAPRAPVRIVKADQLEPTARALRSTGATSPRNDEIAAIVHSIEGRAAAERCGCAPILKLGGTAEEYARELFAALHTVDEAGGRAILIEAVPRDPAWWAVSDRLTRASAGGRT